MSGSVFRVGASAALRSGGEGAFGGGHLLVLLVVLLRQRPPRGVDHGEGVDDAIDLVEHAAGLGQRAAAEIAALAARPEIDQVEVLRRAELQRVDAQRRLLAEAEIGGDPAVDLAVCRRQRRV
jgi:hypothetical protein